MMTKHKRAELVAEAFKKGSKFSGCGEIISDRWEKDGKETPQLEVRVIEFDLPPKDSSGQVGGQVNVKPIARKVEPAGAFDDMGDDIPF